MIENWEQFKDLEYYPDRVCKCGCGGRIKVISSHKYDGIPKYIKGHHTKGKCYKLPGWEQYKDLEYYPDRVCSCGCGGRIKVRPHHSWCGIPIYINGHRQGRNFSLVAEVEAILSGKREAPFCKCGCGERIKVKLCHKSEGIPKFIRGHNSKNGNNHFLGHKHTEEAKEANRQKHLGENNPNFGKRGEGVTFYGGHHTKEARRRIGASEMGENNCNWNGGSSFEEYPREFTDQLKEGIRERDNYTCQRCSKLQEENGRKLDVHHIDYIKKNCDETNLITLCIGCNAAVNADREYWTEFFQGRIELIYGVLV